MDPMSYNYGNHCLHKARDTWYCFQQCWQNASDWLSTMDLKQFNIHTLKVMFSVNVTNGTLVVCLRHGLPSCPVPGLHAARSGSGLHAGTETRAAEPDGSASTANVQMAATVVCRCHGSPSCYSPVHRSEPRLILANVPGCRTQKEQNWI